jgi:hypothetical protein
VSSITRYATSQSGWRTRSLNRPTASLLFDFGNDADVIMDFILVINTINFAFSHFETGVKLQAEHLGKLWCDSVHPAVLARIPFFDGAYLSAVTREQLGAVFLGNVATPMLDERVAILNDVGQMLCTSYDGHVHNFVRSCSTRLYDGGNGTLERLVSEFPRFDDKSRHGGHVVHIFKFAQLAIWSLHMTLSPRAAG